MRPVRVNFEAMEPDDLFAKRADDPLSQLVRQDLDPLSIAELELRIAALTAEIERCRDKMNKAVNHRATAESLFKQ